MFEQRHFESIGHGYFVVYGQLIGMVADTIDPNYKALPKMKNWESEINRLNQEQVEGYYWQSPIRVPATGLKAIYEGQARFIQLQFLDQFQIDPLTCEDWRKRGYFSGIYIEAFEAFLHLSNSEWPEYLDDPLVALFLLICDLAINPTRGMPLEIEKFENFIFDVDVGTRFTKLCLSIKDLPHIRHEIKNFSKSEYIQVSNELTKKSGYDHPMDGMKAVQKWYETAPELEPLMDEYKTFEYQKMNISLRVLLSHFVALYKDKLERPEFFCWLGIYLSKIKDEEGSQEIWLRHLSLFGDRGDKEGVYPRNWPNRSKEAVMGMFQNFYGTMMMYDLCRQWILLDGPFAFDYGWLKNDYHQADGETWGNNILKQVFGISLDDFEIIK